MRTDVPLVIPSYVAKDGSANVAVTPTGNTVVVIKYSHRGDCNSSGAVNAGDLSAGILEYFDADLPYTPDSSAPLGWLSGPGGTSRATPTAVTHLATARRRSTT